VRRSEVEQRERESERDRKESGESATRHIGAESMTNVLTKVAVSGCHMQACVA